MSLETAVPHSNPPKPQYARFLRRLRGLAIDWIVMVSVVFAAVLLATTVRTDDFAQLLGTAVVIVLLLYEPFLVWTTGSTLGHYFSNLRVVDDRRHGNVSFPKALARFLIKGVFGLYSFVTMTTTRRHQALHDLLTGSTVQICDPARASPHHYVNERLQIARPGYPSRIRRVLVIGAYLFATFSVFVLGLVGLTATGLLSRSYVRLNMCSEGEHDLNLMLGLGFLAVSALCIGFGWNGRLFGAHARSQRA